MKCYICSYILAFLALFNFQEGCSKTGGTSLYCSANLCSTVNICADMVLVASNDRNQGEWCTSRSALSRASAFYLYFATTRSL